MVSYLVPRLRRADEAHPTGYDATTIARRAVHSTPVVEITRRAAASAPVEDRSASFHQSFVRRLS